MVVGMSTKKLEQKKEMPLMLCIKLSIGNKQEHLSYPDNPYANHAYLGA